LTVGALEPLGIYSGPEMLYTYPNGDVCYIVSVMWICRDFSGEMLEETDETAALGWFDLADLPAGISPPSRRPLRDLLEKLKNQERGRKLG
jgi:hypothetical protein